MTPLILGYHLNWGCTFTNGLLPALGPAISCQSLSSLSPLHALKTNRMWEFPTDVHVQCPYWDASQWCLLKSQPSSINRLSKATSQASAVCSVLTLSCPSQLGKKGILRLVDHTPSLKEIMARTWDRNLEAGAEAKAMEGAAHWLFPAAPPAFSCTQDRLSRGSTTHNGVRPFRINY